MRYRSCRAAVQWAARLAALALAAWPVVAGPRDLAAASRRPAAAVTDAAAPPAVLSFELYADVLNVTTMARVVPAVRLLDASGVPIADAWLAYANDGVVGSAWHWTASFRVNGEPLAVIEPGQTISVTIGDASLQLAVPPVVVRVDAAKRTVTGRAPSNWPVELRLADATAFGRALPQHVAPTQAAADGAFRFVLEQATDVGAGVVATVTVLHPDGHRVALSTAEPAAIIELDRATLFADYGARPSLAFVDDGGEAWRSRAPTWLGAARYAVRMDVQVGDDPRRFEPRDDQRARLDFGGVVVAEEPVGAPTWRFDPEDGRLDGRTLPGARLRYVGRLAHGPRAAERRAAADGTFAMRDLGGDRSANFGAFELWSWAGGRFAFGTRILPTAEFVDLYGHHMALSWAYGRDVEGTYRPATGQRPIVRRSARGLQRVGGFDNFPFDWFDDAGRPAVLSPGDRIGLRGSEGVSVTLTVPPIAVRPLVEGGRFEGVAPPYALVTASIWPDAGDVLSPHERLLPTEGIASVTAPLRGDDRLLVQCPWLCANAFARLTIQPQWAGVGTGRPRYQLYALGRMWSGAAVHVGALRGFATAGTVVSATLVDGTGGADGADGSAGGGRDVRRTISGPPGPDRLPRWTMDWSDRFPDGLPPGTRFALDVGLRGRAVTLTVPHVTIDADVVADTVRGTAPAGATVEVWALPNLAVDAMRKPTKAVAVAVAPGDGDGADGVWEAVFEKYNVRAEDDLVVNVLGGRMDADAAEDAGVDGGVGVVFFQYDVGHVVGPPEATPGATPSPTGAAFTPTATLAGTRGRVWLPVAARGAALGAP